jgi:predicted NBD/HSP70 family sugar kinase
VRAREALDRMGRYLGIGVAALVTGLAPELIVVIGEVTRAWQRIGPIVDDVVKKRTLTESITRIVPTDPAMQPRWRGAVTLVVPQHFGAPNVA